MVKRISPVAPCPITTGLSALPLSDQNKINLTGLTVDESSDLDKSFKASEPNAPRWDYYIGVRRKGELYLEVHKVSESEIPKLFAKADWLYGKINSLGWPKTEGRPLYVAPTAGISPFAAVGPLRLRLASKKIDIVMKGDNLAKII